MTIPILIYFIIINLVAFGAMALDKAKARAGLWRIPEATLMLLAIIGGSIGAIIGMRLCHHKTKHPKFFIGLPLILAVQIGLLFYFLSGSLHAYAEAMVQSIGKNRF